MKKLKLVLLFALLFLTFPFKAKAFSKTVEGKVFRVREEKIILSGGEEIERQNLEVELSSGENKGQVVFVVTEGTLMMGKVEYQKGDLVLLELSFDENEKEVYYLTDFVRRKPLLLLFFVFIGLVVVIGGWRGAASLLGLLASFSVVVFFLVPQIAAGRPPLLISIISALLIIPLTFYLSHGINRKTSIAVASTILTLVFAGLLAHLTVEATHLTGLVSEEVGFLQSTNPNLFNVKGLLLAGIFLGLLGVLDDVTVSQSAIVEQLREANPQFSQKELFLKAMKVGKDHIASMVNTLVLVYAGASLPLLLLFSQNPQPFLQVINFEIIAEEIVRMLVGSTSLVLAVPLTTILASGYPKTSPAGGGTGFHLLAKLFSFGNNKTDESKGKASGAN